MIQLDQGWDAKWAGAACRNVVRNGVKIDGGVDPPMLPVRAAVSLI